MAGSTNGSDFPVTSSAIQPQLSDGTDGFVARYAPSTNKLLYASYFGGTANDSITNVHILIGFPPSGIAIHAPAASLAVLAEVMSRFTERPIVDMTGLEGQCQFELTFEPETMGDKLDPRTGPDGTKPTVDRLAPSLFDAVQQYGLKLEARKAPIEMLTVTHVEKTPTEN